MDDLPSPGLCGETTFEVTGANATTVFGEQRDPPGRPAAVDADPDETLTVLGTPHVLARVEFLSRETLRGSLPPKTGVVGERAEVHHRQPVPVGATATVRSRLDAVEGRRLTFDGRLRRDAVVATASVTLRVVERNRFRDAVSP